MIVSTRMKGCFAATLASCLLPSCALRSERAATAFEELSFGDLRRLILGMDDQLDGACRSSLAYELEPKLTALERNGVRADAEGVFFVSAGDAYLWVNATFVGIVDGIPTLVWADHSKFSVSNEDYEALMQESRSLDGEQPRGTNSVHNPCTYVVYQRGGKLSHAATQPGFGTSADSDKSPNGFDRLGHHIDRLPRTPGAPGDE